MPKTFGKVGVSSGFEIPEVEDDIYIAKIVEIKDGKGTWEDQEYEQYVVEWALDGLTKDDGSSLTLAQFVRIPPGVYNGDLNPDSNLYKLMAAIGCDMEEPDISPAKWLNKKARIDVENKEIKSGKNAGQIRPRIKEVRPLKKGGGATKNAPASEERELVIAGAKVAPARRPAQDDDGDDF